MHAERVVGRIVVGVATPRRTQGLAQVEGLVATLEVSTVLLAMPSLSRRRRNEILARLFAV